MTTSDGTVTQAAPAKINLSLHVTGQRSDGYHLLDSLVVFTDVGDVVTVTAADTLMLIIDGPFAAALEVDDTNLVLRAARAFNTNQGAAITLTKNLPVASGIGGGSADAAATLRALSVLWDLPLPTPDAILALGADVPVCMTNDLSRMQGIGNHITRIGLPPHLNMVLVNPGVAVPTAAVFGGLASKHNPPMTEPLPDIADLQRMIAWLSDQRNDLEAPACAANPVIAQVLADLRARKGCVLARMSGSGATCFAILENSDDAANAQRDLQDAHPDWWVRATTAAT